MTSRCLIDPIIFLSVQTLLDNFDLPNCPVLSCYPILPQSRQPDITTDTRIARRGGGGGRAYTSDDSSPIQKCCTYVHRSALCMCIRVRRCHERRGPAHSEVSRSTPGRVLVALKGCATLHWLAGSFASLCTARQSPTSCNPSDNTRARCRRPAGMASLKIECWDYVVMHCSWR